MFDSLKNFVVKERKQKDSETTPDFRNLRGYSQNDDDDYDGFDQYQQKQETTNPQNNSDNKYSYNEKMKRNPYIRAKYIKDYDSENQKLFMLYNTRPYEGYKLRYYNYFTTNPKHNFYLQKYLLFYKNAMIPPSLLWYLKFSNKYHDQELDRYQDMLISSPYSPFYKTWNEVTEREVILSKEYRGFYSTQFDYQYFKTMMETEINNPNN